MRLIGFEKLVLCALMLLAVPLANTVAQDEPHGTWRAPPVGTKAEFNYGADWEVVAVEGGKIHVQGARSAELKNVSWYIYRGMLDSINFEGNERIFDTEEVDRLFPLEVGNKTTINSDSKNRKIKITYEVVAFKRVKTKFGTRQLFKIEFTEKGKGFRAHGWGFYDPEYGVWIGGDYTYKHNPVYKWRLISLDMPE